MVEIDREKEIEEQIKKLCAEWCTLNNKEGMDIIYLPDRVYFGEL